MIRARSGRPRAEPLQRGFSFVLTALAVSVPQCAQAAEPDIVWNAALAAIAAFDRHELAGLALTLGILVFAVVTSILLVRARAAASAGELHLRSQIVDLTAEVDRVNALLLAEPQIVIAWAAGSDTPDIVGDTAIVTSTGIAERVLAFGSWLDADQALRMEHAVEKLRLAGEGFSMPLLTAAGRPIEAQGRAIGGRAVVRLRDVSGVKRELAGLHDAFAEMRSDVVALRTLLDAFPMPVWARDAEGRLDFVNAAYAKAVEAQDATEAVERGLELLDSAERADSGRVRGEDQVYRARVPVVAAGARRMFDVCEVPTKRGASGVAIDVTEIETMRAEVVRSVEAHRRTLDQLSTAVAIFGADRKLSFHNAAYRSLFDFDPGFLDHGPTDSAILDRLRAERKLPEEQDYRQWKAQLHEAYRALEPREMSWHLPDLRTLRVVTTPSPQGGVTYLFDDVTERLDLERRFDSLIRVQGETLDNLAEAVAVFSSDGRLRLYNPAFARMWKLAPEALAERPHIEAVIAWCAPLHPEDATLRRLRATVTAIGQREPVTGRLERRDGSVVVCATLALPDGATLITFQDITDSVNVERALRERNEALVAADQIKVGFVQHVSYELRSPLTNIIGFAHFLADTATGPLNARQAEYLDYITISTNALLAIINDILDLATIDAGAMSLNLGTVDIGKTMQAAAEGVRDRLAQGDITLDIRTPSNIGSFEGDERRVRQILFNLLSNAVGFSPRGSTVTLSAELRDGAAVFSVTDQGPGIPDELAHRVFERFETHPLGSQHRGAGLGLSIVRSFVELHGGTVSIESAAGTGTKVTCRFPLRQPERSAA